MTKRFLILIILCLAAIGAPVVAHAQDQDEEESGDIVLVPFVDNFLGVAGVVPEEWVKVNPGTYTIPTSTSHATLIAHQTQPGISLDRLKQDLGILRDVKDLGTREAGGFTWELYRASEASQGLEASIALTEDAQGAYFIILQTGAEDYDTLHEAVFLPAVDAFEVLSFGWGDEEMPLTDTEPAIFTVEVIADYPHDPSAFTQGLLWHEGALYESTGHRGESTLREVDPETGQTVRQVEVPEAYFAEGLALTEDRFVQLTWQAGHALVYDMETLEQTDTWAYEGEGWGLCYDGDYFYMSDGSPAIQIRDPETFEVLHQGRVTFRGELVKDLNELECVGDYIYANVWKADVILQIDKANGQVVGLIDASELLAPEERAELEEGREVLNGIAYNTDEDTFYLTGKHWPKLFEVRFVEKTQ